MIEAKDLWVVMVKEDYQGELFIELPIDIVTHLNVSPGDNVLWIDKGDGSYQLIKVTDEEEDVGC